MRNVAVVAVTDAGAMFGLTPEYVSELRGRARRQGSAGLRVCHPAAAPGSPRYSPRTPRTPRTPHFSGSTTLAFAAQARHEGRRTVAKLFTDTAAVELGDHFTLEAGYVGLAGSNEANLKDAVTGEDYETNSLAYHLARLGWRDLVQLDKGPRLNPGGSTGHASNFIYPVDHSREMTDLTLDSVRQYKELGVHTESGGFEVARSAERMQELTRTGPPPQSPGRQSQTYQGA